MTEEIKDWRHVCRLLLELDEQGYKEPWREFEWFHPREQRDWKPAFSLGHLIVLAYEASVSIRRKPSTVRVTTHNGEVLKLPEPWWDVPYEEPYFFVTDKGEVLDRRFLPGLTCSAHINTGNAFRTREDAKAWADAMPRIKGGKRHD